MNTSTIVELLNGKVYKNYAMALCPFHGDSRESLMIYAQGFKCLACGKSGSLEYLQSKVTGQPLKKSNVHANPQWRTWQGNNSLPKLIIESNKWILCHPDYQNYLQRRKLKAMIESAMIGYRDGYYLFPIFNEEGSIVSAIARTGKILQEETSDKYFQYPNDTGRLYFLDWNTIKYAPIIYVVFGILDMLSMSMLGYPCITWSTGKNFPPEALTEIRVQIVVIPDMGEEREGSILASSLGWRGRLLAKEYPEECKDINDILMRYDENAVHEFVKFKNDIHKLGVT